MDRLREVDYLEVHAADLGSLLWLKTGRVLQGMDEWPIAILRARL